SSSDLLGSTEFHRTSSCTAGKPPRRCLKDLEDGSTASWLTVMMVGIFFDHCATVLFQMPRPDNSVTAVFCQRAWWYWTMKFAFIPARRDWNTPSGVKN